MIKWFYTAGHLFTVLKQFGELTDEVTLISCNCHVIIM